MTSPTVRVVRAGWPSKVYVAVDRPGIDKTERELLDDDIGSLEAGMRLAESKLRERGVSVGEWAPIGPCVRQAVVFGGEQ